MSIKHPIIAVTGSSGAGTTTVKRSFEHIFRREKITSAVIEGDSMHKYDRAEMKKVVADAEARNERAPTHFGPDSNELAELEGIFKNYGETGHGKRRFYLHNADEAKPYGQEPGTFTPWETLPEHGLLAEVWARFGSSPPLALVGAGPVDPRHPDLSAFARRTGVQAFAFGRVPEPQLAWLYRHATLLLFPSRYEGFGSPLAEALDHGIPAIVSDIPAFREIGEGAAHFVAPDRAAVWGEAVAALAADSGERERMRAAGRRIAARLTYEQTARDVLGSLRDAVAGGTSA